MIKNTEKLFLEFIWDKNPAKFSKVILESEIKNGDLKLHNMTVFDEALELGWIKRYLSSNGKWKIFVDIVVYGLGGFSCA